MKILNLLPICAIAAVVSGALTVAAPAEASSLKPYPAAVKVSGEQRAGSDAVGVAEPEAAECPRIRRRLWVENEGWIVRRVVLCR